MSDSELALVSPDSFETPTIIARAGPSTRKKFFEFFTVPIRNANTRAAYYRAIQQFLAWVERAGCGVRGCFDHAQKLLNFTFDKRRRFTFTSRKSLGLDFPGRIHGQH